MAEGGPGTEERVVMHVDMNAFFASVEQRVNPRLRGKPVIVTGNRLRRTVVATASYEARSLGVKTGMPLGRALRVCPSAVVVAGTPARYVDTAREIFRHVLIYTPLVEAASIDEMFLDVTGTGHFFGGAEEIARKIKGWIGKRYHLTCSAGIGPNKLIAKLASGMKKPDGLVRIYGSELPGLLEKMPVDILCGIGEKLKDYLFGLGIVTCGDLARADEKTLTAKFGIIGKTLKEMGAGIDRSAVIPNVEEEETVKSMGNSHTLERDTRDPEIIKSVLLTLSEKVGRRLRAGRYQGKTVVLTLRFSDFFTFSRQTTVDHYLDDGLEIYRLCLDILNRIDPARRSIRMTGVSVSGLVRNQAQLYWLPCWTRRRKVIEASDRINDRWGEWTITPARTRGAED